MSSSLCCSAKTIIHQHCSEIQVLTQWLIPCAWKQQHIIYNQAWMYFINSTIFSWNRFLTTQSLEGYFQQAARITKVHSGVKEIVWLVPFPLKNDISQISELHMPPTLKPIFFRLLLDLGAESNSAMVSWKVKSPYALREGFLTSYARLQTSGQEVSHHVDHVCFWIMTTHHCTCLPPCHDNVYWMVFIW